MKILVIRFSSIGDIVLTTPVLRGLRQQLKAEVHVVTKPAFVSLLEGNPHVAKVIRLQDDFNDTVEELKREEYDEVIDLHHNLRSQRIKMALKKPAHAFRKLNIEKWLLVRFKINRLPELHLVDRYMETVDHLGVKKDGQGLDFFLPPKDKMDIEKEFGFNPFQYIAIVIGAAHQTKCLTADQLRQVCDTLDMPVILLGGKEETGKANQILSRVTSPHVKSAVGQSSLLQSASIVEQAGAIITHDTGMMHIAAAFKKQLVVVWGNTVPHFGMYPYYGSESIRWISYEQTGLNCRPCSKIGFDTCPRGHFKCMLQHDITSIANSARSLLQ